MFCSVLFGYCFWWEVRRTAIGVVDNFDAAILSFHTGYKMIKNSTTFGIFSWVRGTSVRVFFFLVLNKRNRKNRYHVLRAYERTRGCHLDWNLEGVDSCNIYTNQHRSVSGIQRVIKTHGIASDMDVDEMCVHVCVCVRVCSAVSQFFSEQRLWHDEITVPE